jgi:hypothetical protein
MRYISTALLAYMILSNNIHASGADDICVKAAECMRHNAKTYKKYVKDIEKKSILLKNTGWLPGISTLAKKIAKASGYSFKEVEQAKVLTRFVQAGELKDAMIRAVMQGEGAEILERVFSELKSKFGILRKTVEIRAELIDLLHKEMMQALNLKGSKDWFCDEIERKNKKKQYVIHGQAFNTYLHHMAVALFATYWFEKHII